MIVASLLLIFVAVMLLVLGLADGSSTFLISSIVASLLAAVALVIGARQVAGARRAAAGRTGPALGDPALGDPALGDPGLRDPALGDPGAGPHPEQAPVMAAASAARGPRQTDPSAFADDPPAPDEGLASPGAAHARAANRDDAESALLADAVYRESAATGGPGEYADASAGPASDLYDYDGDMQVDFAGERLAPTGGLYGSTPDYGHERPDPVADYGRERPDPAGDHGHERPDAAAEFAGEPGTAPQDGGPEYDRASSFIGGARSATPAENAWRREHAADDADPAGEPLRPDGPQRPADPGTRSGAPDAADDVLFSTAPGFSDSSGLTEEFGEPDEDDPDDEPLPQAVRPADAVRVARMSAEVFVVDGRPRYHMADCPHLVGRLTEPLPAAEAVELGFSPCGLCRPVDRLVARAAHR